MNSLEFENINDKYYCIIGFFNLVKKNEFLKLLNNVFPINQISKIINIKFRKINSFSLLNSLKNKN